MADKDPRAAASDWRGFTNYISRPNIKWYNEDITQYAPAINVSKILQLYIGPMKTRKELRDMTLWAEGEGNSPCWDNWVYKSVNGITNCSTVVYLKSDNMQFSIDVKNKFTDMSIQGVLDKMNGNLGNSSTGNIIKGINGAVEIAYDLNKSNKLGENYKDYMGALYIPKYANIKAWEGMEPIVFNFPTFTFSFGQYGLYNARKEVVEPIMALCSSFLPVQTEKDANGKPISYRWQGPIPTSRAQLITIFKSLAGDAKGAMADFLSSVTDSLKSKSDTATTDESSGKKGGLQDTVDSALDKAINIKDGIYKSFDDANKKLLEAEGNKLAYFRLGRGTSAAIMGPFYVQGVKPQFDFKNTDIYGFPTSGSISFEGTSTPILGNTEDMDIFGLVSPDEAAKASSAATASSGPAVTK